MASVIGTGTGADTVTLLSSGSVSVSAISTVIGASGSTDTVTLLTNSAVSVSQYRHGCWAPAAPPTPSPC